MSYFPCPLYCCCYYCYHCYVAVQICQTGLLGCHSSVVQHCQLAWHILELCFGWLGIIMESMLSCSSLCPDVQLYQPWTTLGIHHICILPWYLLNISGIWKMEIWLCFIDTWRVHHCWHVHFLKNCEFLSVFIPSTLAQLYYTALQYACIFCVLLNIVMFNAGTRTSYFYAAHQQLWDIYHRHCWNLRAAGLL